MPTVVEIHLINVENGDATAIAVFEQDGTNKTIITSILIDGGYRNDNLVYEYMVVNGLLKDDKIDLLIITHFHADHFDGLMWAALNPGCIGQLIDPGGGDKDRHQPRHVPKVDSTGYVNIVTSGIPSYPNISNLFFSATGVLPLRFSINDDVEIVCISGSGAISDGKSTTDIFYGVESKGYTEIDANATSLGFVLRFEDFRYFTAGDLSGDVSTVFADKMAKNAIDNDGAATFMKANHHGSLANNPDKLLNVIDPDAIIIPCALKRWALPRDEFIRGTIDSFREKDKASGSAFFNKRLIFANRLSTAETVYINSSENAGDFASTNLVKTPSGDYETPNSSSIIIAIGHNTVTTLKRVSDSKTTIMDFKTDKLVGCVYEHYSTLSSPIKTKISNVAVYDLPKFPNFEFKLILKNTLPKKGQTIFEKIYGRQQSGKVFANPAAFVSCVNSSERKKYRDTLVSTYKDVAVGLALLGAGITDSDLEGQNEDAARTALNKITKVIAKSGEDEYSSLIDYSKKTFSSGNKKYKNMLRRDRTQDELHQEVMKKLVNGNFFSISQQGLS